MPTMNNEPPSLQEFAAALAARDPKTVATYLTTVRDFVVWLATQPGGTPFHLGLVTETAVRGYMDSLVSAHRAPEAKPSRRCAASANGPWMKAISVGIRRVRLNVPLWWPWPLRNSQTSSALSSKRRWSSTPHLVLRSSLRLGIGRDCASVRSRHSAWISVRSINGQAVSRSWMPKGKDEDA